MAFKVVQSRGVRADHIAEETGSEWMARMKAKWLAEDYDFNTKWGMNHVDEVDKLMVTVANKEQA